MEYDTEHDPTIEKFRDSLKATTWRRYKYHLRDFLEYVKSGESEYGDDIQEMSPTEMIKYLRAIKGDSKTWEREQVNYLIEDWKRTLEKQGLRTKSIKTKISTARSFFKHLKCELPSHEALWSINAQKPKVEGKLTTEDIKEIILSMNTTYQAVFTSMFQAGGGFGGLGLHSY